jgi:DNA-binding MarR family transcriptional regulator
MDNERRVGIQLRNVNNIIKRYITNQPASQLMNKLTGTNTWLLAYVAEQTDKGKDVFQKDIEETFCITRSCVSKVISLMEQKGFIRREAVESDARLKKLVLTEEAAKYAKKMKEDADMMERKLIEGFSEQEVELLCQYLERISQNIENADDKLV